MPSQQAAAIVNMPLDKVEARLRDVATWPRFLIGLESVTQLAHERYRLEVKQGKRLYEVDVSLYTRPREHRFAWRALSGPRWDGELKLSPEGERRTRIRLSLRVEPRATGAVWAEMVSGSEAHALMDLYRLQDVLGAPVTHEPLPEAEVPAADPSASTPTADPSASSPPA